MVHLMPPSFVAGYAKEDSCKCSHSECEKTIAKLREEIKEKDTALGILDARAVCDYDEVAIRAIDTVIRKYPPVYGDHVRSVMRKAKQHDSLKIAYEALVNERDAMRVKLKSLEEEHIKVVKHAVKDAVAYAEMFGAFCIDDSNVECEACDLVTENKRLQHNNEKLIKILGSLTASGMETERMLAEAMADIADLEGCKKTNV